MKRFNVLLGFVAVFLAGSALADVTSVKLIPWVKHDLSLSLKDMAPGLLYAHPSTPRVPPLYALPLKLVPRQGVFVDKALQPIGVGELLDTTMGVNFLGLGVDFPGFTPTVFPPDPNASVGLTQVVQWVNQSFAVFGKSGDLILGPTAGNAFWAGFGGPCETQNNGDPIVKYDQLADRWVMTQFAIEDPNHRTQCVAVSTSADATGSYYRYSYDFGTNFNDYAKLGVWPDGYYMLLVMFPAGEPDLLPPFPPVNAGPAACVMDRANMLVGNPANIQCAQPEPSAGIFLPSDLDGQIPPPAGSPNYFVGLLQDASGVTNTNHLAFWTFHVDWSDPNQSTFTGPVALPVKPFDPQPCASSAGNLKGDCAVQPGTDAKLEVLNDRPMYRLAYRHFKRHKGNIQSLVLNHNVLVNQVPATRWYEIRVNEHGVARVYQQGTYVTHDSNARWMGSIAMDKYGNMALGYSVSGPTLFPSIRFTGRRVYDALNTMRTENTLVDGGGFQLPFNPNRRNRWGDYSSMAVDPSDDCTFWYTSEYIITSGIANWSTRIASFKFPNCQ